MSVGKLVPAVYKSLTVSALLIMTLDCLLKIRLFYCDQTNRAETNKLTVRKCNGNNIDQSIVEVTSSEQKITFSFSNVNVCVIFLVFFEGKLHIFIL